MAEQNDTFYGTNIGIPQAIRGPGIPQRIQLEEFAGIDGGRALYHGVAPRVIELTGHGKTSSVALLKAAEAYVQSLIGLTADLVHYTFDDTTGLYVARTYSYCRLAEYYLVGPVGYNPGFTEAVQDFYARFEQDYW